jgi:hypothetical protein
VVRDFAGEATNEMRSRGVPTVVLIANCVFFFVSGGGGKEKAVAVLGSNGPSLLLPATTARLGNAPLRAEFPLPHSWNAFFSFLEHLLGARYNSRQLATQRLRNLRALWTRASRNASFTSRS